MKKLLISLMATMLLVACAPSEQVVESTPVVIEETTVFEPLSIISPMGAPSVSLIKMDIDSNNEIEYVSGADLLKAAFVNPKPQYDIILGPSNLGAMLAQADKTSYKMLGVVSWGNLYIIGNNVDVLSNPDAVIAIFGEASVPGLVFEALLKEQLAGQYEYYGSVQEAQAALLSGNADAALIAEPAATATILTAKTKDIELIQVADLQSLWLEKYGSDGFAQAAVFVSDNALTNKAEAIANFEETIASGIDFYADDINTDQLVIDVDTIGADVLGVPSAAIISKTYNGMNLRYVAAKDCKDGLESFLSLFNITDTSTYIVE
jgi:NitT/TauT family transport system substrate-binding protein